MGSGEVAIVALSTMISLKVTFSDGLGGGYRSQVHRYPSSRIFPASTCREGRKYVRGRLQVLSYPE